MSGHNKFSNIKHKKEKSDSGRGRIITKLGRYQQKSSFLNLMKGIYEEPTANIYLMVRNRILSQ